MQYPNNELVSRAVLLVVHNVDGLYFCQESYRREDILSAALA